MKKAVLVLLAVAALGTVAAAIAWAAASDSAVIHACVTRGSNLVRIPSAGGACRPGETGLDWNAQGPAGPPGPPGPAGPAGGAAGEPNVRTVGFLHVQGAQGTIDGEATDKGHERWITVVGFDGDATVPIVTSGGGGSAAGKIDLKPLVITKPIDTSSPKLFEALATGELLPAVQLDLVRSDGSGGDEVFYSVKLKDALVSDDHQFDQGKQDGRALEAISFVYRAIEISAGGSTGSAGGPAG